MKLSERIEGTIVESNQTCKSNSFHGPDVVVLGPVRPGDIVKINIPSSRRLEISKMNLRFRRIVRRCFD